VKPDRKRDNFEEFNKSEYEAELIKKEKHYNDCLEYIEKLEREIKRYQSIVPLEAIDTRYSNSDYLHDIPSHKEGMHEYLELVLHHPLLQSYEQNVRSLEKDLENQDQNFSNLKLELEKSMEENEYLREILVKKTKELNRSLEGSSSIPLPNENDRDRARRLGGTSDEMLHYIETMKNDQEALVDQIESLKIRNENLEKITEGKESRFHELQSTAEEANTQYFKMRQEFDKLKHMYDSIKHEFIIVEDKLEKESRDKDELLSREKKLENEMNQLNKHLNHLKESYNDLSDKKSAEVDALSRELGDYDLHEREFKGRIEILEKTKFDVEEELRQLKRELASTKSDNHNMIQIMEQYENEIESYKRRAKQVDVLTDECK
jgi:chromosome segregation ATPase